MQLSSRVSGPGCPLARKLCTSATVCEEIEDNVTDLFAFLGGSREPSVMFLLLFTRMNVNRLPARPGSVARAAVRREKRNTYPARYSICSGRNIFSSERGAEMSTRATACRKKKKCSLSGTLFLRVLSNLVLSAHVFGLPFESLRAAPGSAAEELTGVKSKYDALLEW